MKEKKNISASVRQLLLNQATESGEDFNLLLKRFANERFLYRFSISEHRDSFLLKGASLFTLWFNTPHRPTRDIDLLGYGSNNENDIQEVISNICKIQFEDGLIFDSESIRAVEIKEGEEYQGVRVLFDGFLGKARISLQIDVGFGDVVTPNPLNVDFPALLDFPAPKLNVYPKETVVAEKFEAMVKLGMTNSRMKDFWDLYKLLNEFEFNSLVLTKAMLATFDRRKTSFPTKLPIALTADFAADQRKLVQWKAFIQKNGLEALTLEEVVERLIEFFEPIIQSVETKEKLDFSWAGKGWIRSE